MQLHGQRSQSVRSLLFYHDRRLHACLAGQQGWTRLRAADRSLAQQTWTRATQQRTALASDLNDTLLGGFADGKFKHVDYLPYGFSLSTDASVNLPGFNGEQWHATAGCYVLGSGYRCYNPVLMRFNSADSWSPFGAGGCNAYCYVSNDPVNNTDPSGHMPLRSRRASSPDLSKTLYSLPPLPPRSRRGSLNTMAESHGAATPLMSLSQRSSRDSLNSFGSSDSFMSTRTVSSTGSEGFNNTHLAFGKNVMKYLRSVPDIAKQNAGWKLSKKSMYITQTLTDVEQFKFDIFQDSIHHFGVSSHFAAQLMGRSDNKQMGQSGIWQVRLSKGGRMTYLIQDKMVVIRDVGGHT